MGLKSAHLASEVFSNPELLSAFENRLSSASVAEWETLNAERDPQMRYEGLVNFGRRLQSSGNLEAAAQILAATAEHLKDSPDTFARYGVIAQRQYLTLVGRGDLGGRAEWLLDRFCAEASDPASLVAMGLAQPLFRFGRLLTAARFQRAAWTTEALAFGGGFLAETSGFTLSHKAIATALGKPQDWSFQAWGKEMASAALFLGSLKAFGQFNRIGIQSYMRSGALTRFTQEFGIHSLAVHAIPQLGNFVGILLGHRLQERFGFREKSEASHALLDGAVTLLQLHVGASLVSRVFSSHSNGANSELELRMKNWREWHSEEANKLPPSLASATLLRLGSTPYLDPNPPNRAMWMEANDTTSGKKPDSFWTPEKTSKAFEYLVRLPTVLQRALSEVYRSDSHVLNLGYTLSQVSFPDPKSQEVALLRLSYSIKRAREGQSEGTYADWLVNTVFEDILEKNDSARAERLLKFLAEGGSMRDFEKVLAKGMPSLQISRIAHWLPERMKSNNPLYAMVQTAPLPQDLRDILFRWSYTQNRSQEGSTFHQSEGELLEAISAHQWNRMGLIRGVLETAARSPLGVLRLKRMSQLLRDQEALQDFTDIKLAELADSDLKLLGSRQKTLSHPLFRSPPSQFNAYLGARAPEGLLHEIQKRLPSLLNPESAANRAMKRRERLAALPHSEGIFGITDVPLLAAAFEALRDPYSKRIAKALRNHAFDIQVLSDSDFEHSCRLLSARAEPENSSAQFFPASEGRERGVMLVRERSFDYYSNEVAPDALFSIMGKIAHEYQHYLDMQSQIPDTPRNRLLLEMNAHLRDALWKAEHGDTGKLASYSMNGVSGLALHFRNEFERSYATIYRNP